MVSGLVTSPCDQLRIFSGEASEIRMESKSAIKLARSYGEDLIMPPKISHRRGAENAEKTNHWFSLRLCVSAVNAFSPLPAPCRALRAASSSIPHRDRATAIRE